MNVASTVDIDLLTQRVLGGAAHEAPLMGVYCGLPRCELLVGTRTLDLMDSGQGFRIASLYLGFPEIREDATDAPDRAGTIDLTALFGARAVTIAGSIVAAPAGSRSASLALLTPFLHPAARPTLIYQTDTDVEPRRLTLRVSGNTAPLELDQRDRLDGVMEGARRAGARSRRVPWQHVGPSFMTVAGRTYDLTFDRQYPSSSLPANTARRRHRAATTQEHPAGVHHPRSGAAHADHRSTHEKANPRLDHLFLQDHYTVGARSLRSSSTAASARSSTTPAPTSMADALAEFRPRGRNCSPANRDKQFSFFATGTAGASLIDITWHDRWLI